MCLWKFIREKNGKKTNCHTNSNPRLCFLLLLVALCSSAHTLHGTTLYSCHTVSGEGQITLYLLNKVFHSNWFSAQKLFSTPPSLLIVHQVLHYCHTVFHLLFRLLGNLQYNSSQNELESFQRASARKRARCRDRCIIVAFVDDFKDCNVLWGTDKASITFLNTLTPLTTLANKHNPWNLWTVYTIIFVLCTSLARKQGYREIGNVHFLFKPQYANTK